LRKFFESRAVRAVGVGVLFVIVVALLFLFLNWYIAPTKPSGRKDLVLALAQILGGTALLSGLYFTWRSLQVNREGQITERFTRAIDQLGATDNEGDKLFEIRIGGIYALERISRESEEDYWPIMEILTAYVRQHAHWTKYEAEKNAEEASRAGFQITEEPAPTSDIQAIVTVLWRRTRSQAQGEPEPLKLFQTNLRGAYLKGP
jgi:hypothetical protein